LASAMLHNAAGDKAVTMTYDVTQLPYFSLWKNTTALEEGYVTGLEPGTGFPPNCSIERKAGRVPKLKPNETRQFTIEVAILVGKDQVNRSKSLINDLQAKQALKLNPEPIKAE